MTFNARQQLLSRRSLTSGSLFARLCRRLRRCSLRLAIIPRACAREAAQETATLVHAASALSVSSSAPSHGVAARTPAAESGRAQLRRP